MRIARRRFLELSACTSAAVLLEGCITAHEHLDLIYPLYRRDDLADAALDAARAAGARHADVRIVRCRSRSLELARPPGTARILEQASFGAAVRVLVDGQLGFAAGTDLTSERMAAMARDAVARARAAPAREVTLAAVAPGTGLWLTPLEEDPFSVPIERWLDAVHAALGIAGACGAALTCWREERLLVSSDGAHLDQLLVRVQPELELAREEGLVRSRSCSLGGGFEAVAASGVFADDGERPATGGALRSLPRSLVDGDVDLMLLPAALAAVVRASVAAAGGSLGALTVVADRTSPRGVATVGYDDDGVPALAWTLFARGVRTSVPTTRWGADPSRGCAYGAGWWQPPEPTLPNLVVEPASAALAPDALAAGIERGLLLEEAPSVSVDPTGANLLVAASAARIIERGERGERVRGVLLEVPLAAFWSAADATCDARFAEMHGPCVARSLPAWPAQVGSCTVAPARFRALRVRALEEVGHA